jgi:hypothetical protein
MTRRSYPPGDFGASGYPRHYDGGARCQINPPREARHGIKPFLKNFK